MVAAVTQPWSYTEMMHSQSPLALVRAITLHAILNRSPRSVNAA
jgi:hypothetical protein